MLHGGDVTWAGCWKGFHFFFQDLKEIALFTSFKWKFPPQLTSKGWIKSLAFLVDFITYLNAFNIFQQDSHKWPHKCIIWLAHSSSKLFLWKYHLARNNLANFPTWTQLPEISDGIDYIFNTIRVYKWIPKESWISSGMKMRRLYSVHLGQLVLMVQTVLRAKGTEVQCSTQPPSCPSGVWRQPSGCRLGTSVQTAYWCSRPWGSQASVCPVWHAKIIFYIP